MYKEYKDNFTIFLLVTKYNFISMVMMHYHGNNLASHVALIMTASLN